MASIYDDKALNQLVTWNVLLQRSSEPNISIVGTKVKMFPAFFRRKIDIRSRAPY